MITPGRGNSKCEALSLCVMNELKEQLRGLWAGGKFTSGVLRSHSEYFDICSG